MDWVKASTRLSVSAGALSPAFSPGVESYTVDVGLFAAAVTLTPAASDGGASGRGCNRLPTELRFAERGRRRRAPWAPPVPKQVLDGE